MLLLQWPYMPDDVPEMIANQKHGLGLSCNPGGHIPYRDSKLTRILQPSLGGNAKTAIICAITPAAVHADESHSTLRFACRAKRVVNNATVNEVRPVRRGRAHIKAPGQVNLRQLRRVLAASVRSDARRAQAPGQGDRGAAPRARALPWCQLVRLCRSVLSAYCQDESCSTCASHEASPGPD